MSNTAKHNLALPEGLLSEQTVLPTGEIAIQQAEGGVQHAAAKLGVNVLKMGIIAYEMTYIDDAVRYGLTTAALAHTQSPLVGAAILGGSTLITGTAAVFASARWVAQDRIGDVLDATHAKIGTFKEKINTLLPKIRPGRWLPNVPERSGEQHQLPLGIQAAVALNLGSVALLEAKQRADSTRTTERNVRDGMVTASLVSGYMAIEGGLIGAGVSHFNNPVYVTAAALGVGGLTYGVHKLRQKMDTEKEQNR